MTPRNTHQFLFGGYSFEEEQDFKKLREELTEKKRRMVKA